MRARIGTAAMVLFGTVAGGLTLARPGAAEEAHHHEVRLGHGRFEPARVEVEVGETVTWIDEDAADPQSVTADDGSFDSHPSCSEDKPGQCMKGGDTFEHTFTRSGSYPYHSRTEGGPGGQGMSGVVTVVEDHAHG